MAVAFLFEGTGLTADNYEGVMRAIGRESVDAPDPEGMISHIAGPTANGWRVVDVWESEESAGRFYGTESFQQAIATHVPGIQPNAWPLHRIEAIKTVKATGAASS